MNQYLNHKPSLGRHATRLSAIGLLLALCGLIVVRYQPAQAAPANQDSNLLQNPGFEQPFVDGVADNWRPWYLETEKEDEECLSGYHFRPKWNVETTSGFVAAGLASQYIGNNWDTWSAGVYQTVPATPGVTYRFTFSARGRASNETSPEPSEAGVNMNVRAGIDPNGSGAWNDSDVVWGGSGSPHDAWQQFSVEALATGDQVTLFTSADFGVPGVNQCRQFQDTWYDSAQLTVAGPAPTNTAPPAPTVAPAAPANTAAPQPSPTIVQVASAATDPAMTATAQEVAVDEPLQDEVQPEEGTAAPSGGTICVNAFHDENGNGLHEPNEGYMAGVTFTLASQDAVIGQAISDGMPAPSCFGGLAPNQYQVAQEVPGRLEMTTAANTTVEAAEGRTVGVEFGSRIRVETAGDATAESAQEASPTAAAGEEAENPASNPTSSDLLAYSGLVVIVLAVILLGVVLFLLLRR
jgi:hypothetical protein